MNTKVAAVSIAGAAVLTGFLGMGVGALAAGMPLEPEVKTETVTVTETPEPAPTVTETTEAKTVTEVPQSCVDALDDADAALRLSGQFAGIMVKTIKAAATQNVAVILDNVDKVKAINAKLAPLTDSYPQSRDECKGA